MVHAAAPPPPSPPCFHPDWAHPRRAVLAISLHLLTLSLRLHLPLLPGFAPVVAAPLPLSAPRVTVILTVAVAVLSPPPLCPSAHPSCRSPTPNSPTPHMPCVRVSFSASKQLFSGLHLHPLHKSEVSALPFQCSPSADVRDVWNLLHQDCPVRFCNLHCASPRCVMILCLCRETAGGRLAHGRRRRDPHFSRSCSWCRRLWGRDGSARRLHEFGELPGPSGSSDSMRAGNSGSPDEHTSR